MAMTYSSGFDLANLKQKLFIREEKMNKAVQREIREGAKEIMEQSKRNAPVDTHNLEEAHHIVEGKTRLDNISLSIEVSGEGLGSEDPRPVEEYAMEMHEGQYHLGPKSAAKAAAGNDVGPKYLERALTEKKPEVIKKVRQAMKGFNN